MGAGAILAETNLQIETFTVKANEDIEVGEIVYNDGNGILAASAGVKGPFMVALESLDYSEVSEYVIRCGVFGKFEVQKVAAGGANKKGRYVEVSATDGAVTIFDYSSPGDWWDVVGTQMEDSVDADTTVDINLGLK